MSMIYYPILSAIFGPILTLPKHIAEFFIAVFIIFIITIFYKFLINQNKMKELKDEQKKMQEKVKELQKTKPEEANKLMSETLKLTNKQMMMNFKPMIATFIFIIAFLPWLATIFEGPVVLLPFTLPYFGADFGWLMWYVVISFPLSMLFRKILGVQ